MKEKVMTYEEIITYRNKLVTNEVISEVSEKIILEYEVELKASDFISYDETAFDDFEEEEEEEENG